MHTSLVTLNSTADVFWFALPKKKKEREREREKTTLLAGMTTK